MENKKDATGKEIILGDDYGYSQSRNGYCEVSIGTATHFTETGYISLKVYERRSSLYNDEAKEDLDPKGKRTVCKPAMVFPVYNERKLM